MLEIRCFDFGAKIRVGVGSFNAKMGRFNKKYSGDSWFGTLLFVDSKCDLWIGFSLSTNFVVDWGAFFGGNGGEIGKKCVTLHFDELKPRKNTLNN